MKDCDGHCNDACEQTQRPGDQDTTDVASGTSYDICRITSQVDLAAIAVLAASLALQDRDAWSVTLLSPSSASPPDLALLLLPLLKVLLILQHL
jgi:hypothetical protein